MQTIKIMPTTFLLISVLAMITLHLLLPVTAIIPSPWNLLGIVPLALGVMGNLAADSAFRRVHTTVKPFAESSVLVTDGVFRISRNPMYLGFVLVLIGIAVLLDWMYFRVEEQMLAEKFGAQWGEYRR